MNYDVIIVGAGQSGLSTAASLRQKKFSGSILLIGAEKFKPYQRPPLSKGFLSDSIQEKSLYLKSENFFEKQSIDILTNTVVSKIKRDKKMIVLDDNQTFNYGILVICTGSRLKKIKLSCSNDRTHYLRTIEDALEIRNIIESSKEIVILGGGYIGLEVAASALKYCKHISIIEMDDRLLSRSISKTMAGFLQKKHENAGIKIYLGTSVLNVVDLKNRKRVMCSQGVKIDTDGIIIAVGIEPEVGLAKRANIECENGIVVDEHGTTSDTNIFSAGDCTFHTNSLYENKLRLESVHNAIEQARTVASSIIGNNEPYNQVPCFWSDQYNLKLKVAGIRDNYDSQFILGEIEDEKFAIFFIKEQRIVAVECINHQKAFLKGKKLILEQGKIPKKALEDNGDSFAEWIING